MGLLDKLFGEFVDVIDWTDDSNNTMVYRFERHGNEIKYGAKLTVRDSQVAIFVNEGEIADVIKPGMYELETKNLPLLSTLQSWSHAFESPFKAEVYFCNTHQFVDLKWGTKNPIMIRDAEFGGVRLRAFGTYAIRIADAAKFMREIVGTDGHFTTDEISDQLRNLIISRFTTIAGASKIPILDMAANYDQFSEFLTEKIAPEFEEYGLQLTKILVENISLPASVEEALDKRTSMGMIGNLDDYLKYESAEALGSGQVSSAMDMGMGFAMANKMADSLNTPSKSSTSTESPPPAATTSAASPPPPLPTTTPEVVWHVAVNEQPTGPHDLSAIKALIGKGDLNAATLVWSEGMKDWQEASSIDEIAKLIPPAL
jgi:membrane protease subunit (stomatin/prohibitin family)